LRRGLPGGIFGDMKEITQLLQAIEQGDPQAARQLLPLVYDELRCLAAAKLAQERPGQTLDATALVHEAYLRLVGEQQFANRRHFLAAAAQAMRRILIENARRKQSQKRGAKLPGKPSTPLCSRHRNRRKNSSPWRKHSPSWPPVILSKRIWSSYASLAG
jgi:RNA polymerase sigma factor (TIGR02999 family)